ncbi:LVIVD repeat-containing protein [Paraburkholderia sp. RL17-337-BIB-A]|uniref:LVIVD repeat-containing protein n=1 Tax=Paraburkholderia sp. RL17-337-BIB-A TaxID=3031636 RepID=UPI0038B95E7E
MTQLSMGSGHRIRHLGHCDMGGRPDGTQVIVHKKYAYVGHAFNEGVAIIDVADPTKPTAVGFIGAPPNTRASHIQVHGDLLLVVNAANVWKLQQYGQREDYFGKPLADSFRRTDFPFSAGVRVYDISRPTAPREIAFLPIDGIGAHRLWYVGGRYATVSAHFDGFTDTILAVLDLANPERPEIVSRCWLPGMNRAEGETPTWSAGQRFACHHAIVHGNLAYGTWRDGGFTIHDIADPARPRLLSYREGKGHTHTALPIPGRGLAFVCDEATTTFCANGLAHIRSFDVSRPENPIELGLFPVPSEENFCKKGGGFGPHNFHENRPDSFQSETLLFATYHNAGVRVYDTSDATAPKEIAYFVPRPPERIVDIRPGASAVTQSTDVYVDKNGIMYVTDPNAGLNILQYEG